MALIWLTDGCGMVWNQLHAMWLVVIILGSALRKRTPELGLSPVLKLDWRRESCTHPVGHLWMVANGVLGSV